MTYQPPTWFDQRPDHPIAPLAYRRAQEDAADAWAAYQAYVDTVFDGEAVTQEQHARIKALLVAACAAEDAKDAAYRNWMTGGFDATRSEPGEHIRHMVGE